MKDFAPVSVVIPCFRCAGTIERAVKSIAAQTWIPKEVILIEDFSIDGTLEKIKELRNEYSRNWIKIYEHSQNEGPGKARNTGWEHATQPYVAFLDADDAWHVEKIRMQMNWMLKHPDVILTGHSCRIKESTSEILSNTFDPLRITQAMLLRANRFSTPTVILKRDIPYRFLSQKRHSEDYLLWCQICLDGNVCYWSPVKLTYLFKAAYGEGGLSSNLWLMEKGELNTYKVLFQEGKIGGVELLGYSCFSFVKFLKRVFL